MAVKHGTIPRRPTPPPPTPNLLDLLDVRVGKEITKARPFELATDAASGEQYPSRASTMCPSCGHGIFIDITREQIMSGIPLTAGCANCKTGMDLPPPPLEDPFRNPLAEGVITRSEIDPLYTDPSLLKTQPKPTAASRISSRRKKADNPRPTTVSDDGEGHGSHGDGDEAAGPSGAAGTPPDATEKPGVAISSAPTAGEEASGDLEKLLGVDTPQDSATSEGDIRLDVVDTGEEPEEV